MSTTLITPREALKILTWTSHSGLYTGAGGTHELTRYPVGKRNILYSKEECEALRDKIIAKGKPIDGDVLKRKPGRKRRIKEPIIPELT